MNGGLDILKMKPCFIDIHCHLDLCKDMKKAMERARKAKVGIILTQGVDRETNKKALELAGKYKEVKACLGLYPINALQMSDDEIEQEIEFIRKNKENTAGIGEVGMDFKEDSANRERQRKIFAKFIELSIALEKPIIVHSRKAELECIELLEKLKARKVIMHCFCGSRKLVERIVENKWHLTIPTSVTYMQQFQNNAKIVPLQQLFCETDSPYLHPEKGRNNEPANVAVSYEKIAELKEIRINEVKEAIYKNYIILFSN